MMDRFEEKASTCNYLIHSMEMEDTRQQQWLEQKETNHKSWCVVAAVYASALLQYEDEVRYKDRYRNIEAE